MLQYLNAHSAKRPNSQKACKKRVVIILLISTCVLYRAGLVALTPTVRFQRQDSGGDLQVELVRDLLLTWKDRLGHWNIYLSS